MTKEYFTDEELRCRGSGILKLHPGFREALNLLRHTCGFPFIINSCCRSPDYNTRIGGHKSSLHITDNPRHPTLGTMAIDISTKKMTDAQYELLVVEAAKAKWSIGENKKQQFIHLDRRVDIGLPQARFDYE